MAIGDECGRCYYWPALLAYGIARGDSMSDFKNQPFAARVRHACAGLRHAVGAERNLRLQLLALGAMLVLLGYLRPAPVWWALVLLAVGALCVAGALTLSLWPAR